MDGGAWWATVHGVTESDTTESTCARTPLSSGLCIRCIFVCTCILRFHFFHKNRILPCLVL